MQRDSAFFLRALIMREEEMAPCLAGHGRRMFSAGGLRSATLEVGGDEKTPRLKEPGMIFDGRRVGR